MLCTESLVPDDPRVTYALAMFVAPDIWATAVEAETLKSGKLETLASLGDSPCFWVSLYSPDHIHTSCARSLTPDPRTRYTLEMAWYMISFMRTVNLASCVLTRTAFYLKTVRGTERDRAERLFERLLAPPAFTKP